MEVMDIGYRQLFGKYIPGLPDDAAFVRRLRAPHEKSQRAKEDLKEQFRQVHG
ncbi:MAG: hypothetical protein M3518_06495 [Actinomycetota bacterium]|nr:hypothetical protein [Actinomycetota bacterium]